MPIERFGREAIYGLSILASSAINAWSSHQNRKSSEKISAENRAFSEKMQVAQMKISMLQQEAAQTFQRELTQLNHENLKEIEAFRQSVNIAINQKNLDFQKWRLEQEKQIQHERMLLEQEFQRELVDTQHQNALEQIQGRIRTDRSPIINLAADLLENSFAHGVVPLKVLLSPPQLDYDSYRPQSSGTGFESFLAEEIRQFLHQGYLNNKQNPVQLLDKAWSTKSQGGGSAVHSLYAQLKSIPVLVLESETIGDELNFRLGYWNGGNTPLTENSILSRYPYQDLLYEAAKKRALDWKTDRQKLQELGKDQNFIGRIGGIEEENLQILEKELAEKAELEQLGIEIRSDSYNKSYKLSDKDYKNFYEFLAVCHCLTIGVFADVLFLSRSWQHTPLLPTLLPYLLNKYQNRQFPSQFWQEAIPEIVKTYEKLYDSLELECSSWMPKIRIKFALTLANLPDEYQDLALQQAERSVSAWLRSNGVASDKIFDVNSDEDYQLLKNIVYQEDEPLFQSLGELLAKISSASTIDSSQCERINRLLQGWQNLKRRVYIPKLPQPPQLTQFEFKTVTVSWRGKVINRETKQAQYFTEILPEDISLEMVAIPSGTFMMGSPAGEGYDDEKPQHEVTVSSFFMGKYPITQAQWRAIAKRTDLKAERDLDSNPARFKGDRRPIEQVSWYDAVEFCARLSLLTGKEYRLPSEAEWEYACRAGTTTPFYFGETISTDLANYDGNYTYANGDKGEYRQQTTPVGNFPPNAFGLYDMYGNVWEWCADAWHDNYEGAPTDGSAWLKNGNDNRSLLRGGSWNFFPERCRSADRVNNLRAGPNNFSDNNGFRVVCGVGRTT